MSKQLRRILDLQPLAVYDQEFNYGLASSTVAATATETNSGWIRLWAPWYLTFAHNGTDQPGTGANTLGGAVIGALDSEVQRAGSLGLNVIIVSYGFATWANGTAQYTDSSGWIEPPPNNRPPGVPAAPTAWDADRVTGSGKKSLYFRFPTDTSPTGPWAQWLGWLYDRYAAFPQVKAIEVLNEPNLQPWPLMDGSGNLTAGATAGSMMITAAAVGASRQNRLLLLGPATSDWAEGTSRTRVNYNTFTDSLLAYLGAHSFHGNSTFAWSHHNYADVALQSGARAQAVRAKLATFGWQGWVEGAGPSIWITEGGAAYDGTQASAVLGNWTRSFSDTGAGAGIASISQYGVYGETSNDHGIRNPLITGGATRPSYTSWITADALQSIDGWAIGEPAVSSWGLGRLDVFARGQGDRLYHRVYDNSQWYNWEDLGGSLASAPSAVCWSSGRIDVFAARSDGQLQHSAYANSQWYAWDLLGSPPGGIVGTPTVTTWGVGRLDVFARGADSQLWHRFYANDQWYPWESLGGTIAFPPTAVAWGFGRIDVIGVAADGRIYRKTYDGGWSSWGQLDGTSTSAAGLTSWAPGRLDLFVRGTDMALFHRVFDNGQWYGWERLGGHLASRPAAACWAAGRIDMFATRLDRQIGHKVWNGSQWVP